MFILVPSETRDHYVRIVDSILAASDLNTISAKRIRKGLQTAVDHDITPHKVSSNHPLNCFLPHSANEH
jgi:upstream activation factor subunit UAF30